MWRETNTDDAVCECKVNKLPGNMRIVAIKNQQPPLVRIRWPCMGLKVDLKPGTTQYSIGPTVRRYRRGPICWHLSSIPSIKMLFSLQDNHRWYILVEMLHLSRWIPVLTYPSRCMCLRAGTGGLRNTRIGPANRVALWPSG